MACELRRLNMTACPVQSLRADPYDDGMACVYQRGGKGPWWGSFVGFDRQRRQVALGVHRKADALIVAWHGWFYGMLYVGSLFAGYAFVSIPDMLRRSRRIVADEQGVER